jgi:hypothetical protein
MGQVPAILVADEVGRLKYLGGKPFEDSDAFSPQEVRDLFPKEGEVAAFRWDGEEILVLSTRSGGALVREREASYVVSQLSDGTRVVDVYGPQENLLLSLYAREKEGGEEEIAVLFHSPGGIGAVAWGTVGPDGQASVKAIPEENLFLAQRVEEAYKNKEEGAVISALLDAHREWESTIEEYAPPDPTTAKVVRVEGNTLNTDFGNWEVVVVALQDPRGPNKEDFVLLVKGPGEEVYKGGRFSATPENIERVKLALQDGDETVAAEVLDRDFERKVTRYVQEAVEENPENAERLKHHEALPHAVRRVLEEVESEVPSREGKGREPHL